MTYWLTAIGIACVICLIVILVAVERAEPIPDCPYCDSPAVVRVKSEKIGHARWTTFRCVECDHEWARIIGKRGK